MKTISRLWNKHKYKARQYVDIMYQSKLVVEQQIVQRFIDEDTQGSTHFAPKWGFFRNTLITC